MLHTVHYLTELCTNTRKLKLILFATAQKSITVFQTPCSSHILGSIYALARFLSSTGYIALIYCQLS